MYSDIKTDEFGIIDRDFHIQHAKNLRSAYVHEQMGKFFKAMKNLLSIDLPVVFSGPLAHK